MDFDPYETWLGIPTDRRPPTYYDLLGVAPDESDQAVIEKAGTRRISNVRVHGIGPHSELSQEVLDELARARVILMDPDRRADYDAKLGARGPTAVPKKVGNRDAPRRLPEPDEDVAGVLGSLALSEQKGDSSLTLDSVLEDGHSAWKKGLILGAIVVTNAAVLGGAYLYISSPASVEHKKPDIVWNDRAPAVTVTTTKRPAPPASVPIEVKKKTPPRIVSIPLDNSSLAGITAPTRVDARAQAGGSEPKRAGKPGGAGRAEPPAVALDPRDVGIAKPGESDPIAQQLDRARNSYQEKERRNRQAVLKDFQKAEVAAQKKGLFQRLKNLGIEKKAFEDHGEIPSLISVGEYQKQIERARSDLAKSLSEAMKKYTHKGNIKAAVVVSKKLELLRITGRQSMGWEPLFNGIDMTGWILNPQGQMSMFARDGVLDTLEPEKGDRAVWLTERRFSNFALRFEFSTRSTL